jgi:putative endopeptidase
MEPLSFPPTEVLPMSALWPAAEPETRARSRQSLAICRHSVMALGLVFALSSATFAQSSSDPSFLPALDFDALDRTIDPCVDFYRFSCGGWHVSNPRPAQESFWARVFTQYAQQIEDYTVALIEQARGDGTSRSADEQKVGDHFASCLDTAAIDARGEVPLRLELAPIERMASLDELGAVLGHLHRVLPAAGDPAPLVGLIAGKDPAAGGQAKRLTIKASSLGLPSREYYLATDDESAALRREYRDHVARMLELLGDPPERAAHDARVALELETALAAALEPRSAALSDPRRIANAMTVSELEALTPRLRWGDLLRTAGLPVTEQVNVRHPAFLRRLDELLGEVPLDAWKSYLRWRLVSGRVDHLPERFRDAQLDFYGRALRGVETPRDRSRICIEAVKRDLPEAVGRIFVERALRPELRARTYTVFREIRDVMQRRIEGADWLEPATRAQALEKLAAMRLSVGHPDRWVDDQRVVIRSDDFYGNVQRAAAARRRASFVGLDEPFDPGWWPYSTITILATYDGELNAIRVAAGMLVFYDGMAGDPAVLYGGIGGLLAHEIVHGFDTAGRWFDAGGGLRDWWGAADAERFAERASCLVEDYSRLEYPMGVPLDGALVVAEQLSELSAWSIAWEAFRIATEGAPLPELGGLDGAQRYFVTGAQTWCSDASDEGWRVRAATSSKAWGAPMVNGLVRNLPELATAFGCRAGQPMVKPPAEVCRVW